MTPFGPLVRWTFNGNNLDTSGHNINFTTTQQQSYASVYQNHQINNQALILSGQSYGTSSQAIPFPDQFTIQMIFNLNSLSGPYNIFTASSSTGSTIFSIDGNPNGKIFFTFNGNKLINTSDLLKKGRTYNLVIVCSNYNKAVTLFLDDVKHGASTSFTFTAGNYFVSSGKGLNGYLDEVGIYTQPVYQSTVSLFDSLLACTNPCPSGQSCYNAINGPACA